MREGQRISYSVLSVVRITQEITFILPSVNFDMNDPRLTIACIYNQRIFPEPIKLSPLVVPRTFIISSFNYQPALARKTFLFTMVLKPTVNISVSSSIVLRLTGFRMSLSNTNVAIQGRDRAYIRESKAVWDATYEELTMDLADPGGAQPAIIEMTELHLAIEESAGFQLPANLKANDETLEISAQPDIDWEPVKISPMVGDGPFQGHQYCMYQYERGTRTSVPLFSNCVPGEYCQPPYPTFVSDPCSPVELERCGCQPKSDEIVPLKIEGFQLLQADILSFRPIDVMCGVPLPAGTISSFSPATNVQINTERSQLLYEDISSIASGEYRICMTHNNSEFDVGTVLVRPSCNSPFVLVDGVCTQHCPRTKIPYAGACIPDLTLRQLTDYDDKSMMLSVKMYDNAVGSAAIAIRRSDDAEQQYMTYRFRYELAAILNCDPSRIKIASLAASEEGTHIVNVVLIAAEGGSYSVADEAERNPYSLIRLFGALQQDASSQLYDSSFFRYVEPFYLHSVIVRQCPDPDSTWRVTCPYTGTIDSALGAALFFFLGMFGIMLGLVCLCGLSWKFIDNEKEPRVTEDIIEKIEKHPDEVEPELRQEYARSWLEGRFMDEEWERARKSLLALAIK